METGAVRGRRHGHLQSRGASGTSHTPKARRTKPPPPRMNNRPHKRVLSADFEGGRGWEGVQEAGMKGGGQSPPGGPTGGGGGATGGGSPGGGGATGGGQSGGGGGYGGGRLPPPLGNGHCTETPDGMGPAWPRKAREVRRVQRTGAVLVRRAVHVPSLPKTDPPPEIRCRGPPHRQHVGLPVTRSIATDTLPTGDARRRPRIRRRDLGWVRDPRARAVRKKGGKKRERGP